MSRYNGFSIPTRRHRDDKTVGLIKYLWFITSQNTHFYFTFSKPEYNFIWSFTWPRHTCNWRRCRKFITYWFFISPFSPNFVNKYNIITLGYCDTLRIGRKLNCAHYIWFLLTFCWEFVSFCSRFIIQRNDAICCANRQTFSVRWPIYRRNFLHAIYWLNYVTRIA